MRVMTFRTTSCIWMSDKGRSSTSLTLLLPLDVPVRLLAEARVLAVSTTGIQHNVPFCSACAAKYRNCTKFDNICCSHDGWSGLGSG